MAAVSLFALETNECIVCGAESTRALCTHCEERLRSANIDYGGLDGKIDDATEIFRTHVCAEEEE